MADSDIHVVTGAFSYSGKYITKILLEKGVTVKTLTGHSQRADMFEGKVEAFPFNFENPKELAKSLEGASVLYNTYWIRFERGGMTFAKALENTKILVDAAKDAGVGKIVHISITNPSHDSPYPYFSGKALCEDYISESGIPCAIVRPTLIFGGEDILIHNIAWTLRRMPVFGMPGSGNYRVQPVFVEDLAEIMVNAADTDGDQVINAVGPEIFTFREMIRMIARKINRAVLLMPLPRFGPYLASRMISLVMKDVMLTWDEINGLMDELLVVDTEPTGRTKLSDWVEENKDRLGQRYVSELNRHFIFKDRK